MELSDLLNGHCQELPAGTPTLDRAAIDELLPLVPGWEITADGKSLHWQRRCADFMDAVGILNRVAALAEEEGHHPDVRLHSYRTLELELSTHSIGGLSQNDFILAAKVNRLLA
jgi:4a-hydroxytetrahydrobiopterin dehydratase